MNQCARRFCRPIFVRPALAELAASRSIVGRVLIGCTYYWKSVRSSSISATERKTRVCSRYGCAKSGRHSAQAEKAAKAAIASGIAETISERTTGVMPGILFARRLLEQLRYCIGAPGHARAASQLRLSARRLSRRAALTDCCREA